MNGKKMFQLQRNPYLLSFLIMVIMLIILAILQPSYFELFNMTEKVRSWLPLILVAVGQTFIIMAGGIDLSTGWMIALVNVVTVQLITMAGDSVSGIVLAMGAGMGVALCAGLINGICVAYLRLQPIITTFATGVVFHGIALWVMPKPGGIVPMEYFDIYASDFLYLPVSIWIILAVLAIYFLVKKTRFFSYLIASGGNISGAFETGLPVARVRIGSFVIGGFFTGLSALCIIGETISGNPNAGESYTLDSISAVVLGGTSLMGGFGGAIGSIFGSIVMKLVNDVIFFADLPVNFQKLMQGFIIIAALAAGGFLTRSSQED